MRLATEGCQVALIDVDGEKLAAAVEDVGAESGSGRIVLISSGAGRRGSPMLHAYCSSNLALVGLTEVLPAELTPSVAVNCICFLTGAVIDVDGGLRLGALPGAQ